MQLFVSLVCFVTKSVYLSYLVTHFCARDIVIQWSLPNRHPPRIEASVGLPIRRIRCKVERSPLYRDYADNTGVGLGRGQCTYVHANYAT